MTRGALSEAIDSLVLEDPAGFADAESMESLHRELARLDAFVTAATAAFDASGQWAPDGAVNAAAWIATRCRLPKVEARRRVHLARRLRHLPVSRDAWLQGDITVHHVRALAPLCRPPTEEALARDEGLLVAQARAMRFESFSKALDYWRQLADPDGAERSDAEGRAERDVYLESTFKGTWLGRITLDPVSGEIVAGELGRLEQQMFEEDWSEAKERLDRDPKLEDLRRTRGQRRADALVEMATRSRTMPADGRRPLPLFSVFVGYETLHGRICELARGTAIAPGSLLPWVDQAMVERAVFGPGRRVEVSATARLFTGATRRAIELRDRVCAHPYCDRPVEACQVDHIVPFAAGGPTTQENGRLLCGFHNRLRNQRPPPPAA